MKERYALWNNFIYKCRRNDNIKNHDAVISKESKHLGKDYAWKSARWRLMGNSQIQEAATLKDWRYLNTTESAPSSQCDVLEKSQHLHEYLSKLFCFAGSKQWRERGRLRIKYLRLDTLQETWGMDEKVKQMMPPRSNETNANYEKFL